MLQFPPKTHHKYMYISKWLNSNLVLRFAVTHGGDIFLRSLRATVDRNRNRERGGWGMRGEKASGQEGGGCLAKAVCVCACVACLSCVAAATPRRETWTPARPSWRGGGRGENMVVVVGGGLGQAGTRVGVSERSTSKPTSQSMTINASNQLIA